MSLRDHVKVKSAEQAKEQDASAQATNDSKKQSLGDKAWNYTKQTLKDMAEDIVPMGKAYGRMGASEVGVALKAFPDSIGPQETTGTMGNPTQQQISEDFGSTARVNSATVCRRRSKRLLRQPKSMPRSRRTPRDRHSRRCRWNQTTSLKVPR